jgi:hypothetical protein
MKNIIKLILLVFVIVVGFKAYNKSQTNEKGIWYNVGVSSKETALYVVQWSKPVVQSIKDGFQSE